MSIKFTVNGRAQEVPDARGEDRLIDFLHDDTQPAAAHVAGVLQRHRDLGQTRFGVAHRGGGIGIHRTEIALTVDQRHAHRPVLRHAGQCVVDRTVAMGVIFTHDFTDQTGGLAIGAVVDEARFLGREENAAMHRLQAVAHVRQGAGDDHGHGIVEIARLHLINDADGADVRRVGEDGLVGQGDSLFGWV